LAKLKAHRAELLSALGTAETAVEYGEGRQDPPKAANNIVWRPSEKMTVFDDQEREAAPAAAAADRVRWRDMYEERAAIRQYDGGYPRAEAERLAWGAMENRWHLEHGERVPRDICAGCRRAVGEAEALDLIDGDRVHMKGYRCRTAYEERWRSAATTALIVLGLQPPAIDCDGLP
jgi:hypothetical protein